MAAGALLPAGYETLEDANGTTVPGGLIWSYAAGTTTPLATFTDSTLTVPNSNPIIADGAGRWTAYAAPGTGFKLVFETPAIPPVHGATIKTCDNIVAPLTDATAGATGGQTVVSDNTTGTQNNFTLTGRTKDTLWTWNGTADLVLTGIAGGAPGDRLTIKNMSTASLRKITLPHMSASSTNPFYNIATSAPTPIAGSGWATYVFVGGTWVLTDHEQGFQLGVPFNAANFVGSAGTWVVLVGQLLQLGYTLRGRLLTVTVTLENSNQTVAVAAYEQILNAAYGGFVGAANTVMPFVGLNGAGVEVGYMQCASSFGMDRIAFFRPASANYAVATVSIYAVATLPVL